MQDPFSRIPVEMLEVASGESVLDLCAAPGGKSRLLAHAMGGKGRLILVDKPGPRLDRLQSNSAAFPHRPEVIGARLEELEKEGSENGLPPQGMDAVLIDVPCSNTGVMQKRPDVKLRLREDDISRLAEEQGKLLALAARWVRPGGRLVYSTCSLEEEENAGVVDRFLEATTGWDLKDRTISLPWECGHDGGGAFLLTKKLVQ